MSEEEDREACRLEDKYDRERDHELVERIRREQARAATPTSGTPSEDK